MPGTKRFAAAAVKAGGAVMHRLGLSETVLVFPEHRAFLGELPLFQAVQRLRRAAPEKKLVIEVKTADAALAAAVAGFDVIQAEKFSPTEIAALVKRMASMAYTRARPIVAAAGGVNAANAADYAEAGADVLVTSSPYLAKPRDVECGLRQRSKAAVPHGPEETRAFLRAGMPENQKGVLNSDATSCQSRRSLRLDKEVLTAAAYRS